MHKLQVVLEFDVETRAEGSAILDDLEEMVQTHRSAYPAELLGVKWDGEYADDDLEPWDS